VTGVRDMGGDLEPLKKVARQGLRRKLLGAHWMIISGADAGGPFHSFQVSAPVKDAAEGRRIVDDLQKERGDFIKIQSLVPRDGVFSRPRRSKRKMPSYLPGTCRIKFAR